MEDRLIKFAHIVDAGSFTKAAAKLHISQPALTAAIKKLERELRVALLLRTSRSLTVTAAGRIAYQTAQNLIAEAQNLDVLLRAETTEKPTLIIGMIDSLANLLFVQHGYLEQLEQYARVSLIVDNSSRLVAAVSQNSLDIALLTEPVNLPAGLVTQVIGEEPLILVASVHEQSNIIAELQARQLHHFISYNQASRTFQLISERFARAAITLHPAFYSTSPEIMLQLVLARRGAAVLPYSLVRSYLERGILVIIPLQASACFYRKIVSIQQSKRQLPLQASQVIDYARSQISHLYDQARLLETTRNNSPHVSS